MNTTKFESIVNLVESNPEAKEALTGLTSIDEAVSILGQYGVQITIEEFAEYVKAMHSDEIPEELLEYVAGGGKFGDWVQGFFDGFYDSTKSFGDFFKSIFKIK